MCNVHIIRGVNCAVQCEVSCIVRFYQLQGLRDALDQVTMEKNSVLSQLALQRDEMSSLANQLAEQQQRLVTMTADKDHLSSELYSCQQSLVGV